MLGSRPQKKLKDSITKAWDLKLANRLRSQRRRKRPDSRPRQRLQTRLAKRSKLDSRDRNRSD